VGRHTELQELFAIWQRVSANPGAFECVILSGPGGIGKTALVMQFRRMIEESGRYSPTGTYYDQRHFFDFEYFAIHGSRDGTSPALTFVTMEEESLSKLEGLLEHAGERWGMLIVETRDHNLFNTFAGGHKISIIALNLLTQAEIQEFVERLSLPKDLVLPLLSGRADMRLGNPLQLQKSIEHIVRYTQ
jgi:hypothetical protein